MKPIIILASGFQKKCEAKLSIAIILLFLVAACKKEAVPTNKSIHPHDLVYKNLAWSESVPDSGFRLQVTTLPERYSLSRLEGVYINDVKSCWSISTGFKHCMDDIALLKLQKDGDGSGIIYYAIVDRTIFLYAKRTSDPYFRIAHEDVILRWQ